MAQFVNPACYLIWQALLIDQSAFLRSKCALITSLPKVLPPEVS